MLFKGMGSRIKSIRIISDNTSQYATEPVTLDEVKEYLQLEGTAYDDQLTSFIITARQLIEQFTNICLVPKSLKVVINTFNKNSFQLPYLYPDEITAFAWRRCPSTLVELVLDSEWWDLGDGFVQADRKGEFTIYYTTEADDRQIFQDAIKATVGMMYNERDSPTTNKLPDEVKAMLAAITRRTF